MRRPAWIGRGDMANQRRRRKTLCMRLPTRCTRRWQGRWVGEFRGTRAARGKSLAFALSGHWVESWVAPPDALEEVVQAENDGVMDCEEEMFTDLAEAIIPVGDRTWCPEEAARNAKLALEAAEMAAAEAESYLMELDMLLKKDLGV